MNTDEVLRMLREDRSQTAAAMVDAVSWPLFLALTANGWTPPSPQAAHESLAGALLPIARLVLDQAIEALEVEAGNPNS